jgi:hypothetical protein
MGEWTGAVVNPLHRSVGWPRARTAGTPVSICVFVYTSIGVEECVVSLGMWCVVASFVF